MHADEWRAAVGKRPEIKEADSFVRIACKGVPEGDGTEVSDLHCTLNERTD